MTAGNTLGRFPEWLRKSLGMNADFYHTRDLIKQYRLATVCDEARCPNKIECFNRKTSTVLILGTVCTRNCLFCSVDISKQVRAVDQEEPDRVGRWVRAMGLRYVVVTSVTRDDLPDGGSGHFKRVAECIKYYSPDARVELLIPDCNGNVDALDTVSASCADVIGHNIETVRRLFPFIRPSADYDRSLGVLRALKERSRGIAIKSSMMLGLGERTEEIVATLADLAAAGCERVVLGQYLRSGGAQVPVERFVDPGEFEFLKREALRFGIRSAAAGPWYRSSYHADHIEEDLLHG